MKDAEKKYRTNVEAIVNKIQETRERKETEIPSISMKILSEELEFHKKAAEALDKAIKEIEKGKTKQKIHLIF